MGRRNPQKAVGGGWGRRAVGSQHRTAEETSQYEIGSSSSEGRPVKMNQHSSWFVEISLEIHNSTSLPGMQCHNLNFLHLSWPKPYCLFVCSLFLFLPLTWLYFLCRKEMCNTLVGTTRWFTDQDWNGLKKLMYSVGHGGIITPLQKKVESKVWRQNYWTFLLTMEAVGWVSRYSKCLHRLSRSKFELKQKEIHL